MTTTAVQQEGRAHGLSGFTEATLGGTPENTHHVYFARQPLLNRDGMLCGFELKIQQVTATAQANADSDASDAADRESPAGVSAQACIGALIRALMSSDVRLALTGHRAYIDATRELLLDEAVKTLPPERFIFELPPEINVDDELIARIIALHGRRFRFVIDHVTQVDDRFARLLPYAETVKIDLRRTPPALLPKLASVLKSAGKMLTALGTDTHEEFETAFNLGFDRFQGYFFARPHTGETARRVSAPRHALLNLLQLLAGEPTVAQLEAELKLNPVLVMHLMRLANASGLALGLRVTTLRDAINATGTDKIARWTQLLLYADGRKVALEDDPLLQLAATRARFMELAVARLPDAGRDEADAAFLTGVFSLVDAVFGGSLENTLNVLMLTRPIRDAIERHEGALGMLLTLIEALERGAWDVADQTCQALAPLTTAEAAQLALTAAAWAGIAEHSADAEGLERIED
ncbi:EAL and HDOD domain-containing protein [Paraburkholderia rhizosphaerae]|uniref:C-di-GMP-related signal transduction protein n=1 Tax=Paraburkholderia rhizosphaerae TaxID=480658 RepID=A0A4R8LI76_9BURK|nr:EAL domain-containing protein [Paraburkholderia rhizosphaerae]TDY42996.1 c-di-GMP-related signal transduction protein [Paraburkholderia rhizosphaerae]